jgi:hypothetical protein
MAAANCNAEAHAVYEATDEKIVGVQTVVSNGAWGSHSN